MKNYFLYFLAAVLISVNFSSCFFFKKNVMEDGADNIDEAVIVSSGNEKFLIMKEEVFQTTSKSSKQGIRTTTGYAEFRLSSYNLNTGELVKRIELGERDDGYQYFLGSTEGKIWYVSMNEQTGVHARDPKTLEIIVSQGDIVKANTFLKDNFPKVKWYELRRYFGFNMQKNMPLVSDNSGVIYEINPETYKAERVAGSISNINYEEHTESTSISVNDKLNASLTGDPRKHIRIGDKEFQDLDFLKGVFLLSSSSYDAKSVYPQYFGPIYTEIEEKKKKIDSLTLLLDSLSEETGSDRKFNVRFTKNELEKEKRNVGDLNEKLGENRGKKINLVVSPDGGFFVLHNSSASDTSKVMISKVSFAKKFNDIKLEWTTMLDNIFSEPDKVFEKGGFEYVFSSGSPDLKTRRAVFSGNTLVYISMLKAVCISMTDGQVLWKIDV